MVVDSDTGLPVLNASRGNEHIREVDVTIAAAAPDLLESCMELRAALVGESPESRRADVALAKALKNPRS